MYLLKRVFDIIVSIIAIIIFLPAIIIIGFAIKLDSKGPILFKQDRLTKNGEVFTMYKFRTMIENAEQMGTGLFNFPDDPRVTRVGKFLRKTSLDEIPQLLNIIKGDMSLVGPRPPVSYELGDYDNLNSKYKRRFTVLPGITGLAQVNGRDEIPWDKKVEYDNQYIDLFKKYGILLDFKIIFLTIINVFKMENVHEVKEEDINELSDEELAKKATEDVIKKARSSKDEDEN